MLNEVPLEAWMTLDSCYLIGWNQKKIPAGITASGAAALASLETVESWQGRQLLHRKF